MTYQVNIFILGKQHMYMHAWLVGQDRTSDLRTSMRYIYDEQEFFIYIVDNIQDAHIVINTSPEFHPMINHNNQIYLPTIYNVKVQDVTGILDYIFSIFPDLYYKIHGKRTYEYNCEIS